MPEGGHDQRGGEKRVDNMADKQEIEIIISQDGHLQYHIHGIKGKKCLEVAKNLMKSLGEVKDIELTSEYYQQEVKHKLINKKNLS